MSESSALIAGVDRFKSQCVLCVGDAMLDRFIYGGVDRISPEAPIPVMRVEREESMLGGAGNVVRNLAALGCQVRFSAVIGDDAAGKDVQQLLGQVGDDLSGLIVETSRPTTIKSRFVAGVQQLLRADRETTRPLADDSYAALLRDCSATLPRMGALVLSDYGKGVLTEAVLSTLITAARAAGVPIVVDPKGNNYRKYRGATVLTPNRKELEEATAMPTNGDDAIVAAARKLVTECEIGAVLVTRSQDGMTLVTQDGHVDHLPAEAREVFDVSGAGDTVVATLAAALSAGISLLDGARLANVAAGLVVGKVGTAVAHAHEIVHTLRHGDLVAGESKILDWDMAAEQVERWRRRGLSVGFTNGCFDLLHPGHISLLTQARNGCDRLVVGLNTDASIKRLKGETRPVQAEMARATVLASLAAVDMVVLFGEDTPLELIRCLKPNLLVKGADYTVETVVGAADVQSWGGRVLLADLVPGQSTTNAIRKMTGQK